MAQYQGDLSINERLMRLETIVENMDKESKDHNERMEQKVNELTDTITKYKGFIGGVMFVFTCIVAFIKLIPAIGPYFGK